MAALVVLALVPALVAVVALVGESVGLLGIASVPQLERQVPIQRVALEMHKK